MVELTNGKRIKILMRNSLIWHGTIIENEDNFLTISDRFGKIVILNKLEITQIEVV